MCDDDYDSVGQLRRNENSKRRKKLDRLERKYNYWKNLSLSRRHSYNLASHHRDKYSQSSKMSPAGPQQGRPWANHSAQRTERLSFHDVIFGSINTTLFVCNGCSLNFIFVGGDDVQKCVTYEAPFGK